MEAIACPWVCSREAVHLNCIAPARVEVPEVQVLASVGTAILVLVFANMLHRCLA